MDIGRLDLDYYECSSVRIDDGVALAPLDLLPAPQPLGLPVSIVLTLWLSIAVAEGLASRSLRSRSRMTHGG